MLREGPGPVAAGTEEAGAGGKAQKLRFGETCILESRLTLNKEGVFHSQCFLSNSPGAIEHSIHRPGAL